MADGRMYKASEVPADVQQQRRHAYVAYQALTSECMVEQLIEDYALLGEKGVMAASVVAR